MAPWSKGARHSLLAALCACGFAPSLALGEAHDFARDIQPIFEERCYGCHGEQMQQGELRLDSRDSVFRGGGSGVAAVVPGNSANSLLYRYVAGLGETRMPPVEPFLSGEQIERIRGWIESGAAWPSEDSATAAEEPDHFAEAQSHWSFQPLGRPSPPTIRSGSLAARVRNPIDAFVFAKLDERGWEPSPEAGPRQLLRRVFLDLTGLPPAIEEQKAFLARPGPFALDRVIDDLLSRPTYGERWGRHWLDLVRYADTNGYERDAIKPSVWRYRDYVIRSFNQDKPFDRFAIEQIAGDELPDVSSETMVAAGFHRLGPWDDEPADPLTDRYDQLDDLVRTTSEAFLGLTLGCARCHNHKFEPLTAADYYSMAAIYAPLTRPRAGRTELLRPIGGREDLDAFEVRDRQIRAIEDEIKAIRHHARSEFLRSGQSGLPARVVTAFETTEQERDQVQVSIVAEFAHKVAALLETVLPADARRRIVELEERICELYAETPTTEEAYILHEPRGEPPASFLLIRGSASNPGPRVEPATPAILSVKADFPEWHVDSRTSLRRMALARWIASPNNPLTARVIVNRVWQFHFGEGIVRTPSDFGLMGEAPTHPDLLDWLASWFIEKRWSIKALHRLIMTSSAYRMSKKWIPDYGEADPANLLLWRVPYRRLEVEAIRDSMLAVSGRLNSQMFGPSMYPYVPRAALEGSSDPDTIWKEFDEEDASRRTIYALVKRSLIVPMLEVLDLCDTTKSSAMRKNTAVPTQALTLFNGEFVNRQARHFARRVANLAGPDTPSRIDVAFRLALARSPTPPERRALEAFLEAEEAEGRAGDGGRIDALVQLCRVIFNMSEFSFAD
ncbi:MAG: PSD1 and planctomycete cytochrome C domain-containing protein [Bryobacterales bacterium]|nr:PSD1 and planctomycete cytochrome C domain-containing protein [Bryobacterales bacterium]